MPSDTPRIEVVWNRHGIPGVLYISVTPTEPIRGVRGEFEVRSQDDPDEEPWTFRATGRYEELLKRWAFEVQIPPERQALAREKLQQVDVRLVAKVGLFRTTELCHTLVTDHVEERMGGGCMPIGINRTAEAAALAAVCEALDLLDPHAVLERLKNRKKKMPLGQNLAEERAWRVVDEYMMFHVHGRKQLEDELHRRLESGS